LAEGMEELTKWFDAKHGRRIEVVRALGLSPGAVTQWRQVPAEHVLKVEEVTGISRYTLRPDVFGPAPEATESAA
jgi:DNA-binding transcriptional regulator YdaS (Cro superfamily)